MQHIVPLASCAIYQFGVLRGIDATSYRHLAYSLIPTLLGLPGQQLSHGHVFDAVGEVTLTGRVLPIGGVKEKTLAARRSGVKTLLFPKGNEKDWDELSGTTRWLDGQVAGFCCD